MKKLSFIMNFVLLGFIFVQSCETPRPLIAAVKKCNNVICSDYRKSPPFQYLSIGLLKNMASNYNSGMSINYTLQKSPDARSVWLPLETIKRFIWEIETANCKAGCGGLQLGIRFYYGRYPAMNTFPELAGLNTSYQGRHTLFMVPTFDQNGSHYDFDPRFRDPDCKGQSLETRFAGMEEAVVNNLKIMSLSVTDDNNMSQNHGELCPPLCKPNIGDDFFTQSFLPQ